MADRKDQSDEGTSTQGDRAGIPPRPTLRRNDRRRRRERRAVRPARRRSIHLRRSRWFQERTAWPKREPDVRRLTAARHARLQLDAPAISHRWQEVGPSDVGGRMTSIVSHPGDPDHIWAGAAGGGVWESTDAGEHWRTVWRHESTLNIGSLAIDPRNPRIIYCGTGEANLSVDSYAGVGLYMTSDGGASWSLVADAFALEIPTRIGALAVDPFHSNRLALGGIGFEQSPSGLFLSADSGASWEHVALPDAGRYWCHSIAHDPTNEGRVYITVTSEGYGSGIYRSEDRGRSWKQLSRGLPPGYRIHRGTLAIAPSDPEQLWVVLADSRDQGYSLLGIFRSTDRGDSWTELDPGHLIEEEQMSYNNTLAIDPIDPDRVYVGGVDLHRTVDGGETWQQVTYWDEDPSHPGYAHADHHAILVPARAPDRVYSVNDGGLDVSYDRGRSWRNRSDALPITMFYDLDVSQLNGQVFAGGAQDNGTPATQDGGRRFYDITSGDGGWIAFDPKDIHHFFASIYYMRIFRFRDGIQDEITPKGKTPEEEALLAAEREAMWMVFLAPDPADARTLYSGTWRVWRTADDGDTWIPISPDLDGSPITAIDVSRKDPRCLYVGTENGSFFRSIDGGQTWEGNLGNGQLPSRTITRIASKPDEPKTVLATLAGYGNGHVFRSVDGGERWKDVSSGLPDAPFHSLVIPTSKPRTVYACGDAGVFVSSYLGTTWRDLTGNLPNTLMVDLVFQDHDSTLSVATYGRSVWRLKV